MPRTKKPLLERLWARTSIDESSGCWVWTGHCFRSGYGQLWVDGRKRTVHSVSADLFKLGERSPGMTIDHVADRGCVYRACWNPAHLEVVSVRENNLRGKGLAASNARKTHCDSGHEFTPENTRVYRGSRYCRACARERAARELRERRAAEGEVVLPPPAQRTHCPQGHPYDEQNTAVSGGKRTCRACNRENARRYRSKRGV